MQVGTLAIQHLFEKDILYRVPLYQRPYVWDEGEQWQPLWDDFRRLAELLVAGATPRAHFLGATVQDREAVPPGQMESRLLIDGQQRLTTLQLVLKALHDAAVAHGLDRYASAVAKLYRNDHPLNTKAYERFKVYPTNADRDDFHAVMAAISPAELLRSAGAGSNVRAIGRTIIDAYLFFSREIAAWLRQGDEGQVEHRMASLYGAIRDNVRLVVIDLDEKDDAQLIFETLNARGTPLLAADLVKNALLNRVAQDGGDTEAAYQSYWQTFDQDRGFWRMQVGRGHAQRPRIELFLQHALTIMTGGDVSAAHLYTEYRDFSGAPDASSASEQLKLLHRYGTIYRRLIERTGPPRLQLFLDRLAVMEFETVYPLLIKLADRLEGDPETLIAVLIDLESFLVRRLASRLSTRGYNTLFVTLTKLIDGPVEDIPQTVRRALLAGTAEVDRWPDDTEFRTALTDYPLYENLTRPRLRLLLEALEGGLRNDLAETNYVPRGLTVEHVMPQSWQTYWPLPMNAEPAQASDRRDRLIHTLGNLTLLNNRLNPMQSNRGWLTVSDSEPGKRDGLRDNSTLFLNKDLVAYEEWSEETIAERAGMLVVVAQQIWHRPALD